MIIFGTRGVTYSAGNGQFHCPECRKSAPYVHKRVRRFFTLYFIPVIPLDLHGEYVECGVCRGTYRMEVLQYDPAASARAFEAEFHQAVKRVMVEMMLADGAVEDDEIEVIRNVYRQLVGQELTDEQVRHEIVEAETRTRDVADALAGMAGTLNDRGKELVIHAAFMVAAADGTFQDEEKQMLGAIGQALEMSPSHVRAVIETILQRQ